jgi:hypothetical protein
MPVVINDFEVVAEPPQQQRGQGAGGQGDEGQAAGKQADQPAPEQVQRAMQHLRAQVLRVWAH